MEITRDFVFVLLKSPNFRLALERYRDGSITEKMAAHLIYEIVRDARLKDAPDDAGEPVKRDVGSETKTQASARLKDAPAAATWKPENPGGFDLRPEPMSEKTVYGRDGCPAPPAIGAVTGEHAKLIENLQAIADDPEEDARSWLGQTCHEAASALASLTESEATADADRHAAQVLAKQWEDRANEEHDKRDELEKTLASVWDLPEMIDIKKLEAERDAAHAAYNHMQSEMRNKITPLLDRLTAERDAALAELTEKDEALGRLIRTCERAQETRDAALAEVKRLRDALGITKERADEIVAAALAKTQEPG